MATRETEVSLSEQSRVPVVYTRWVWVIGTSCTLLFGAGGPVPVWPQQVFVGALLLSNIILWLLLRRGADWRKLRWGFTVADVLVVTLVVRLVGSDRGELYVVSFAILLLATVIPKLAPVAGLTILGVFAYGVLMYLQMGPAMFRDPGVMVRLPFLLGIALYFGSVVQEARNAQVRADKLELEARQIAQRAKHLAKEQYRLRALSEIGRLGLSGVRSDAGELLFDIIQRVQKVVGVDRCSLVIFETDGAQAYVAASGDDPRVEVRVIRLEEYPELQVSLQRGEITELYPGQPCGSVEEGAGTPAAGKSLPQLLDRADSAGQPVDGGDVFTGCARRPTIHGRRPELLRHRRHDGGCVPARPRHARATAHAGSPRRPDGPAGLPGFHRGGPQCHSPSRTERRSVCGGGCRPRQPQGSQRPLGSHGRQPLDRQRRPRVRQRASRCDRRVPLWRRRVRRHGARQEARDRPSP